MRDATVASEIERIVGEFKGIGTTTPASDISRLGGEALAVLERLHDQEKHPPASIGWALPAPDVSKLAQGLISATEGMAGTEKPCDGDPETEVYVRVFLPGQFLNDGGTTNDHPILGVSLAEYPEEGAIPVDPFDLPGPQEAAHD